MTDTPATPAPASAPQSNDRIAKVIARSGVASRRDAEKMILAGRVAVNGKTIASPALDVAPSDRVTIDGKPIDAPQETRVWLYYKPLGLVTTEKDEQGRRTIFDEMPEGMPRVLNVGRLDLNSEGLLLLTNDGGLKRRLELPETGWLRKYRVRVNGRPDNSTFDPLRRGITIDGEDFQPMEIELDRQQGANAWLTVGIREGKNREIRRAMAEIGLQVNRLIRISYGPFRLNDMNPGDVLEVKRKVLRDQMGDRLLLGVAEGRQSREERAEAGQRAREARFAGRGEGGAERNTDRGPRKPFGEKKSFGDKKPFARDGEARGERKSFGGSRPEGNRKPREWKPREESDRKPRGEWTPRPEGDRKPRGEWKPREDGDRKPRGEWTPRPEGDRKPRGEWKPREEGDRKPREDGERRPRWSKDGAKPRAAGFKSHSERDGDTPRGERRSFGDKKPYGDKKFGDRAPRGEGFAPRDGGRDGKPGGFKSGGFKSAGGKPGGYAPRDGGPRDGGGKPGGFKSHGAKSHGGAGKPRAAGFKSHGDRPAGGSRGPRPSGPKRG